MSNWLKVLIKETGVSCLVIGLKSKVEIILEDNAQLSCLFAALDVLAPGDQRIDIFDLVLLGNRFGQNDSLTDLNADGIVNIIDLILAALNYMKNGPVTLGPGAE